MSPIPSKIDIVYTWVDGSNLDYLKLCQKYAEKPIELNPERYRDIYFLLKYSLRSLEMYVPWINNIFLVTMRPQIPSWLNVDHPKINIIHHDEIFEEKYLPSFNPNAIESYLHKIPDIGEYFMYINDDFLFGNHTSKVTFISKEGKISVFGTFFGENLPFRIHDSKNDIIGLGLLEHCPLLIKKQYWEEMTTLFPDKMHQTRSNKFRKPADLMTYKLYKYYLLKYHRKGSNVISLPKLRKINRFHKITNDFDYQKKRIKRLEELKPNFFCLNDDQKDNPNYDVVNLIGEFLVRNYPNKSSFEN